MKVFAVIPAYNEAKVIGRVVADVKNYVDFVVVVNDGSSDKTANVALQSGAKVLTHFINRGQGAALQTGIIFALNSGADIIITFDADGQHNSSEIEKFVTPLQSEQVDVVLGSRFLSKEATKEVPLSKKIVLKLATIFTKLHTGLSITDTHNGFRGLSSKAARKISIDQNGMAHASEILEEIKRHNLRYKEVGVTINYTEYSKQKGQKISNSFRIIWDLFLGRISK